MSTTAIDDAARLATELRASFLNKAFGIVKFWGAAAVPPNDQSFLLVSTHAEGDRLDLVFVTEDGRGLPGVISIWEPSGLEAAPAGLGQGIAIRGAKRLRMDETEAAHEGATYRLKSPSGESVWPIEGEPALVLAH